MGRPALLRRGLARHPRRVDRWWDASFDRQQAQAALDPVTISFTLDGAALATTRKPIKPFGDPQRFGLESAWYFQQGRVMAPDDLSVGHHELTARFTDPTGFEEDGITFFIDAAGTGACVGA